MEYQRIRTAAYMPDPAQGSFAHPLYTLALPTEWEEQILKLHHFGLSEREAAWRRRVPTRNINQLMRATAPDVVTVDSTATFGAQQPWLYCANEYPMSVMNSFIATWLRHLQRKPDDPESTALLMETFRSMDTASLQWQMSMVDLLAQQSLSPGGTASPAQHVYRLLPDVLAGRITHLEPYEHNGERLEFHQVAGIGGTRGPGSGGAELMSWPPREHAPKAKSDGSGKRSYYSAVIRISVRTVPFSSMPRVHLSAGIRRFVTGKVWMPYQKGASVYLRPDASLVPDGPEPQRFSVAMIQWKHGTTDWRQGGAEGMLAGVTALDGLPSVDRLVKEADHWIGGRDGIALAVGHQTTMGPHTIGTGLMPSERRRLIEWAEQALAPELVPVPQLERSGYAHPPKKQLKKLPSIPKKEIPQAKLAAIIDHRERASSDNASLRRKALAEALEGADFVGLILHQTDDQRDRLVAAAEENLGLAGQREEHRPDSWVWESEELTVRLHARPLGTLGAPLGGDRIPRRGKEHEEAIGERRRAVAKTLKELRDSMPGVQVAFVELEGDRSFLREKRRTDPKHAIRLGSADAGLVTQFIRPLDTEMEAEKAEEDAVLRAAAAWSDGLRQTGMRFVPQHTLGELIPPGLNQVAFHLVERRHDGPTGKAQFTPIAVLIRPGAKCIMGKTAEMHQWVPYPELLKSLTGRVREAELKTSAQQSALMAAFIKKTLAGLRSAPTLVLSHAQDIRKRWPWLRNDGLEQDRLGLDCGPAQRIGLYGRHLRVIRIADSSRDETSQWWAEAEELRPEQMGKRRAGIAKGLWVPRAPGETGRVFYSTADKSSTQTKLTNDDAKLTGHVNAQGKSAFRPTTNAWNPELLEVAVACLQPGDNAEAWAAFVHQQRFCDDYRDVLGLPLVLHLARLADQYALPHEDEEAVDPETSQTAVSSPEEPTGQMTFDFESSEIDEE
ncbi:pPIWI_RE module domain-containing protein [Streptomyces sp. NPDC021212]|uniref:pPIWI_RE module domain-containing protein n=1 Tax=Streptomyces sp. NPDC021212 TaxID=3365118 RepID=UPI0037AE0BB6